MKFRNCKDCTISDLYFIDSPQAHISILDGNNIGISNLKIEAPGDSPNTDGIHIHRSNHITIHRAWIGSGMFCSVHCLDNMTSQFIIPLNLVASSVADHDLLLPFQQVMIVSQSRTTLPTSKLQMFIADLVME